MDKARGAKVRNSGRGIESRGGDQSIRGQRRMCREEDGESEVGVFAPWMTSWREGEMDRRGPEKR